MKFAFRKKQRYTVCEQNENANIRLNHMKLSVFDYFYQTSSKLHVDPPTVSNEQAFCGVPVFQAPSSTKN